MGLMEHLDTCMDVGEKASKEYHIEKNLEAMKKEWDEIKFELKDYKNFTSIIRGFDDINGVLDEHIVNTQAM